MIRHEGEASAHWSPNKPRCSPVNAGNYNNQPSGEFGPPSVLEVCEELVQSVSEHSDSDHQLIESPQDQKVSVDVL